MVSKDSKFSDFVRSHPYTYTRTQQSRPPLWAAVNNDKTNVTKFHEDYVEFMFQFSANSEQGENTKSAEKQRKLVFQKNR